MNYRYKTDRNTIEVFTSNSVVLGEDSYQRTVEVCKIDGMSCSICKRLHRNNKGNYIIWDGKPFYLHKFLYKTAEELIQAIEDDKNGTGNYVTDADILATLLKEGERLNVMSQLPMVNLVIPIFNIAVHGDKQKNTRCKFVEDRYKKNEWNYKITLAPAEDDKKVLNSTMYFSDFCTELRRGDAFLCLAENTETRMEERI